MTTKDKERALALLKIAATYTGRLLLWLNHAPVRDIEIQRKEQCIHVSYYIKLRDSDVVHFKVDGARISCTLAAFVKAYKSMNDYDSEFGVLENNDWYNFEVKQVVETVLWKKTIEEYVSAYIENTGD